MHGLQIAQVGLNDIEVLDAYSLKVSLDDIISLARERVPDVLGLTAMTVALNNARRIATAVKADRKDIEGRSGRGSSFGHGP